MRNESDGTSRDTARSSHPQTSHQIVSAWMRTGPMTWATGSTATASATFEVLCVGESSADAMDSAIDTFRTDFAFSASASLSPSCSPAFVEPSPASSLSLAASCSACCLRHRKRPSTYLAKRATIKSGVRWPNTRNCCKALLRSLAVGSIAKIRVTSAFSAPLKPKRCKNSSRRRTTSLEACNDSASRSPDAERVSGARRHSQSRCASGCKAGNDVSPRFSPEPSVEPPCPLCQRRTEDNECFNSDGNLHATLKGSSPPSSSGGKVHLR
mmetsp:Transcript_18317/g.52117  ORF Transcript_18317/g.52117 Transcript_18317/m.52117 type:complete len:269 (-) Transcript_18317:1374-2180(-)